MFSKIALLVSALLISNYSEAACRLVDGAGVNIPTPLYASPTWGNWSIPRDKIVGNKEVTYVHAWNTISTLCEFGTVQTTAEVSGGKLVPGYPDTYETGIPGIGIQFRIAVPGNARYVASGGEIKAGKADATLTYVLQYN
ncbi:hypothetical protein [Burkholderia seminalis]|uniref:hypothetical protein n=1 Tax=Burkholderia seminalis TaxID=488731 RepID=UPI00158B78B7|nr:hypothetical protein [Burkholderia seminalis]